MPEFILDHGSPEGAREFNKLDEFTQGYIEALFFTETGSGDDDDLEDASVGKLAPDAWIRIIEDCERFQAMRPVDIEAVCSGSYDRAAAGRDFLYTRNHHGCGFWEQDGAAWDSLDRAAKGFGEVDLVRGDDGLIYVE